VYLLQKEVSVTHLDLSLIASHTILCMYCTNMTSDHDCASTPQRLTSIPFTSRLLHNYTEWVNQVADEHAKAARICAMFKRLQSEMSSVQGGQVCTPELHCCIASCVARYMSFVC
jgi:hypothetical protein